MDRSLPAKVPHGAEPAPSAEIVELGDAKALTKGWENMEASEANPLRPTRPPA